MTQVAMAMTPSAAARTGANYAESFLVVPGPVELVLAHELECELTDRSETDGHLLVETIPFEQLLRHADDGRGRRAEREVATVELGHHPQ